MILRSLEWLRAGGVTSLNFDSMYGLPHQTTTDLIGLGSSAVSGFPGLLAQNDKHTGRYRQLSAEGRLSASHGIVRSAQDRLRGGVIAALLCHGEAVLSPCLLSEVREPLEPFTMAGLAVLSGNRLMIRPEGLPYARVIAGLFDRYRAVSRRSFSSAI